MQGDRKRETQNAGWIKMKCMSMISCHYTLKVCDSQYYLYNKQNILKTLKVALKHTLITLTIQDIFLRRIFLSQISTN